MFLAHGVERQLALCVVHRHFELEAAEQLVEFNNVVAPWRVAGSPEYLQPGIQAKNWAFVNGRLFPYEFRFHADVSDAHAFAFSAAFVRDLLDALTEFDLHNVYGLTALVPDDLDPTTPSLLEFTAGRTNVLLPFTEALEALARVEASWLFPCVDPFSGPVKTRLCNLQCVAHR